MYSFSSPTLVSLESMFAMFAPCLYSCVSVPQRYQYIEYKHRDKDSIGTSPAPLCTIASCCEFHFKFQCARFIMYANGILK